MSGATKLAAFKKARKLSQGELASLLNLSEGFVSLLLSGKRRAGIAVAVRIEQKTDGAVPASSLVRASERRAALALARLVRRPARDSAGKPTHRD
jgi:transcriptional regulator with XRE-family HTH domain